MLKPAFLFRDELNQEYQKYLYSDRFKYLVEDVWDYEIPVDQSDAERLQFVSLSPTNQILAYFSAEINRRLYKVDSLEVIIFTQNLTSSRDFRQFITDLTGKFGFRKVSFEAFVGSPGESVYDRHLSTFGARVVGIKKQEVRLSDGKLYDLKLYEIIP